MSTVEFTLNGQPVKAPAGRSIFNIAKDLGIAIPHLCHKDGLNPDGSEQRPLPQRPSRP